MFPAKNGDSFLVELDDGKNILIDMGYSVTYKKFIREKLIELNKNGQCIDLLVITHIDQDHIQGALDFICENGDINNPRIIGVKEVWHNSYRHLQFDKPKERHVDTFEKRQLENIVIGQKRESDNQEFKDISAVEGSTLAALLFSNGYETIWNKSFNYNAISKDILKELFIGESKITILSPNNKKLKLLSNEWLKILYKIDNDFKITDEKIFDDAYEVYIANQKIMDLSVEKEVSYREVNLWDSIGESELVQLVDDSKSNGSSIAFLLESSNKKVLFLGDAHADLLHESLLNDNDSITIGKYDVIKLAHHGSKKNNCKILKDVSAKKYLISTDGKKHSHPDIETIAEMLRKKGNKTLYFTYQLPIVDELVEGDLLDNYDVIFGNGENALRIEV